MAASRSPLVCPSVLAADFGRLAEETQRMVEAGADWIHLDVMDGHFVPNISFGPPVIKALRKHSNAFFDCHLMVTDPLTWIADCKSADVNNFTFHFEAAGSVEKSLKIATAVKAAGMTCGISVKPKTAVEDVFPCLETGLFDLLLIMTVEPGFGGQKFMRDMIPKIQAARGRFPEIGIQVDGGLDVENNRETAAAGANLVVAGTSLFKAEDPKSAIEAMKDEIRKSAKSRPLV